MWIIKETNIVGLVNRHRQNWKYGLLVYVYSPITKKWKLWKLGKKVDPDSIFKCPEEAADVLQESLSDHIANLTPEDQKNMVQNGVRDRYGFSLWETERWQVEVVPYVGD